MPAPSASAATGSSPTMFRPRHGGDRNTVHHVTGDGVESWPDQAKDDVVARLVARVAERQRQKAPGGEAASRPDGRQTLPLLVEAVTDYAWVLILIVPHNLGLCASSRRGIGVRQSGRSGILGRLFIANQWLKRIYFSCLCSKRRARNRAAVRPDKSAGREERLRLLGIVAAPIIELGGAAVAMAGSFCTSSSWRRFRAP
jgi:hypothetical protein